MDVRRASGSRAPKKYACIGSWTSGQLNGVLLPRKGRRGLGGLLVRIERIIVADYLVRQASACASHSCARGL